MKMKNALIQTPEFVDDMVYDSEKVLLRYRQGNGIRMNLGETVSHGIGNSVSRNSRTNEEFPLLPFVTSLLQSLRSCHHP
jgi:hypothetical protein